MSMKMQQLLKVILLGSIILSCTSNTVLENDKQKRPQQSIENPVQIIDSTVLVHQLKRDIKDLLVTKKTKYIDKEIFGDCIHFYLNKSEDKIINQTDIIKGFNKIFDKDFEDLIENLKIDDNLYLYLEQSELKPLGDNEKYKNVISIAVPINSSELDSSKLYWFFYDQGTWVFAGMTCVG